MPASFVSRSNRKIAIWLLIGCFLTFVMVAVGGMTRLTNSGLSMVEWNLFMGSIPPTTTEDWKELFDKYKQFPEYQTINFNITIEEFKSIFYWEYGHRMLGRLIGLVFIVPFLWFLIRKQINRKLLPKLLLIFFMGGFQGFLGWYMVKSGLIKNPDVSHYRLALHLVTAFATFGYTFWVALSLLYPKQKSIKPKVNKLAKHIQGFLILLGVQITWGAYVAGLNAGKIYNTWPLMGKELIPDAVTAMTPLSLNFVEGLAGVQFVHRYLAYIVLVWVGYIFFRAQKIENLSADQKFGVQLQLIAVIIQFLLGVFTLIYAVPIALGLLHQLGAFILLGATVFVLHRFKSRPDTYSGLT